MIEHGLEIFEIDQEKPVVVGDLEDDRQDVGLQLIEFKNAGQKKRPHLRNCCP